MSAGVGLAVERPGKGRIDTPSGLRVVYLNPVGIIGGAERALLDLVASLRASRPDWEQHVVLGAAGPLEAALRRAGAGVTVLPYPPALHRLGEADRDDGGRLAHQIVARGRLAGALPATLLYLLRLRTLLARLRPDVVHSNGLKMHLLAPWCAPAGAPVVWHLHDFVSPRRTSAALLRRSVHRVDRVVCNSAAVMADAGSALGAGTGITTLLNATDTDAFNARGSGLDLDALAGMAPAPASTLRVGLVATGAPWKGHDVFVDAIATLSTDVPVRAYIIGGPIYDTRTPQRSLAELRARIAARGLSDRVGLTGYVDDVPAALRALDVVVHASTAPEPFGLVVIEAMACARAVIASDAGGIREIVTHGVDGLLHAPGDVQGLADAIDRLCGDVELRRRLAATGRATVCARFDRRRLGPELAAVYEAVQGERRHV